MLFISLEVVNVAAYTCKVQRKMRDSCCGCVLVVPLGLIDSPDNLLETNTFLVITCARVKPSGLASRTEDNKPAVTSRDIGRAGVCFVH